MDFVKADFEYYQRTIEIMYKKYFSKRMLILAVALAILMIYTGILQESIILNMILALILIGLEFYLWQLRNKFPEVFQEFLTANRPAAEIYQVEEDEYCYNLSLVNNPEKIKVNKNDVRNLPSQNKQYTLMVGFTKNFFSRQPLSIAYYDMLALTYKEKFRLKRNGYSSVPRFLRRFTLGNLKASAGNLVQFVLGNIFALFLLFRLVSYLISIFRSLF
ncbi:hypothetical protein M2139_002525 [Enterococcus sp. PF1-24]|uniref:hypothetical protein n=1 Tax=unclassified Enterococcus TaxID=2608891 RepID=UPI002476AFE2|nr:MULTISPECIES: hypothetical protein [unclassified Enterococcus]MDH6365520.1 hypothetical protein [Enterococcus sp. PFB1-1]MDH6402621.1 hypothetical protein [Enterococcus sp. PF1-24]